MNKTRRIDSTLPRPTAKQRQATVSTGQRMVTEMILATCPHANVIGLADGAAVCTRCEAVIKAVA